MIDLNVESTMSEREEGEISDELEAVSDISEFSDCPIQTNIGKSSAVLTVPQPLLELSLSSVSDNSDEKNAGVLFDAINITIKRHTRKEHRPKRQPVRRCRRRKESRHHEKKCNASSDSEDNVVAKKIVRQLREAVKMEKVEPRRSLRTRLNHMLHPASPAGSDESDLEELRSLALQSKTAQKNKEDVISLADEMEAGTKSETVDTPAEKSVEKTVENPINSGNEVDEDLTALRLNALKSAVLKKHQERKKRLAKEQPESVESVKMDENIVNSVSNETSEASKRKNDDELTNVAKKQTVISNVQNNNVQNPTEEDEDILRAMLLTSITNKISKAPSPVPKLKIIPKRSSLVNKAQVSKPKPLPPAPINRIVISVNSDSESDTDVKTKPVVDKVFSENLSNFLRKARDQTENSQKPINKDASSAVKHLTHAQQLEYRTLKNKLQQITLSKTGVRRRLKSTDVKLKSSPALRKTLKKVPPTKLPLKTPVKKPLKNGIVRNTIVASKNTERLKGRYEELAPLMKQIEDIKSSRDRSQKEVNRLITELKEARMKLNNLHQSYSKLIRQLIKAKDAIDKRYEPAKSVTSAPASPILVRKPIPKAKVDNPVVEKTTEVVADTVDKKDKQSDESKHVEVLTLSPVMTDPNDAPDRIGCISLVEDKNANMDNIECVEMECEESDDPPEPVIIEEFVFKNYESPLDHISTNREGSSTNPLTVICPYDLLGVCRDGDCQYQHYTS